MDEDYPWEETGEHHLKFKLGARALPEKWIRCLCDHIKSSVVGFSEMAISELASRTCQVQRRILEGC